MPAPEIRYQCQRCGNCCRWPGEVVLADADLSAMADLLKEPEEQFIASYATLRRSRQGLALKQTADGACIFLDGQNSCRVNAAKPAQCRAFPNAWRFPGWRQICEATPLPPSAE